MIRASASPSFRRNVAIHELVTEPSITPVLPRAAAHYQVAPERPFTADEAPSTTILFGNLTPYHEALIRAVFRGAGYLCEALPTPTREAHDVGKEFCNNGCCNPNYFTAGNLIQYLRGLQERGLDTKEIADRYVYFTAGGCGPCRFGMYESEYRQALASAGFPGFRVITFQSNKAILGTSQQPGLRYSVNLGLGLLNALNLGDILFDLAHQIRPYEVRPGETDRVVAGCLTELGKFLETRRQFEVIEHVPHRIARWLERHDGFRTAASVLTKMWVHLYGSEFKEVLRRVRARLDDIEVDRTRSKPIVKITGEFFSALSVGDANYQMFRFLESEGAEVWVESIGGLLLYWLYQARLHHRRCKGITADGLAFYRKDWLLAFCDWFYTWQYHRAVRALGGLANRLPSQKRLTRLAAPYYDPLARGGEGHLEVAKSLYYGLAGPCHMVLSLKPFGCLPSTQSDGVMAGVVAQHPDLIFLPVETAGEGEINAHSRVQMMLGDARRRARGEFQQALASTGRSLEEIRAWVAAHRALRRPFYSFRRRKGTAGTAAQFVLHVADLMKRS